MIIAVDGPAGAGKSTVCRLLAQNLGFIYLDTGSMYRAVAWALLQENTELGEDLIQKSLPRLPLRFAIENNSLVIAYRGNQIGEDLRNPEISLYASLVSQNRAVRDFLTMWQRKLATMGNLVAEGRDMTSVVFPHAEVKVFLTADLPTRAKRRHREYGEKGIPVDYSSLEEQIRARDEADETRPIAPLQPGKGAIVLDTSHMEIGEVVDRLAAVVDASLEEQNIRSEQ